MDTILIKTLKRYSKKTGQRFIISDPKLNLRKQKMINLEYHPKPNVFKVEKRKNLFLAIKEFVKNDSVTTLEINYSNNTNSHFFKFFLPKGFGYAFKTKTDWINYKEVFSSPLEFSRN